MTIGHDGGKKTGGGSSQRSRSASKQGGRRGACEAHGDETRARGRMRQKATPFLVPTGPMVRMTAAGTWTLRGKALEREGRASGLAPLATPTAVLAIRGHLRDMPHTGRHRIFCGAPRVRARARGYRPWSAAAPTCRSAPYPFKTRRLVFVGIPRVFIVNKTILGQTGNAPPAPHAPPGAMRQNREETHQPHAVDFARVSTWA